MLTFILLFEVTDLEHRSLYAFIDVSAGFVLVPILFAVLALADISWVTVQVILMIPTSLLVCTFYLVEESPRWLMVTWQPRRAEQVLLWAAKKNGLPFEVTHSSFKKMNRDMLQQEDSAVEIPKVTMSDLLHDHLLRERSATLFLSWFTVYFAFNAIMHIDGPEEQLWVRQLLIISSAPVLVGAYAAMMRVGRRRMLSAFLGLVCWAAMVLAILYKSNESSAIRSIVAFVAKNAVNVAICVNYVYTAELFPTFVRGVGVCFMYASGRFGAVIGTLLLQVSGRDNVNIAFFVLAMVALLSAATLQWLPEITSSKVPEQKEARGESDRKKAIQDSLAEGSPTPYHRQASATPSVSSDVGEPLSLRPFSPAPFRLDEAITSPYQYLSDSRDDARYSSSHGESRLIGLPYRKKHFHERK